MSRNVSAKYINPNVFNALPELARELADMPERWIERWQKLGETERRVFLIFTNTGMLGRQEWEKLKTVADQAFEPGSDLYIYYILGVNISEYEVVVQDIPDLEEDLDQNTSIPVLINSASAVPLDVLEEMALLRMV